MPAARRRPELSPAPWAPYERQDPISDLHEKFKELVDRHYGSVWACVSVLTARSADTEDLVHQAFLLAFERLADGVEFAGDPGQWLRGTARHLVYAWWRQKRSMPEALAARLEAMLQREEDPFSRAARAEIATALRQCLDKLSAEERQLVQRRYEAGEGLVRIAEALQLHAVTVRTRLHRIRQALRHCLDAALSGGLDHGT